MGFMKRTLVFFWLILTFAEGATFSTNFRQISPAAFPHPERKGAIL